MVVVSAWLHCQCLLVWKGWSKRGKRSMCWKEQLFETPCSSMTASQLARGSRAFVSQIKNLSTPVWQEVQWTVCSSATDWRAVLTRWESYTHEWENTLESSTLRKKVKERKYAKGAFTLNHSIALEVNQCSVHTVCPGYSRIILNKRTDMFFKGL